MIVERHFKNEDAIKEKIVEGHKRGVCDKNGRTIKTVGATKVSSFGFGESKLNIWTRDDDDNLIGD